MYLRLDDGSTEAKTQKVISQADMTAVAEKGVSIYQKIDSRYFKLRVRREDNVDPRTPHSYVIDNWVPVEGVPDSVEAAAVKSNKEDANVQRKPLVEEGHLPPTMDPRLRNSPQAKDEAARLGAGNLALKDPRGVPHDGQPAPRDKEAPNTSRPGNPSAGSVVLEEQLARTPGPSETSKPAAPTPPGAGNTAGTVPSMPGPRKPPNPQET